MQRFVAFSKIDDERRMVYGLASDETLDADDEIIDYEATKKAVQEWAEWRNIREMQVRHLRSSRRPRAPSTAHSPSPGRRPPS